MTIDWHTWLSLIIRWAHITAGIAWIGASFYYVWLDNNLENTKESDDSDGELWSVHGGGFYHNKKYKVAPKSLDSHLHWFKWEAYFTWITGFLLFAIIYYFNAKIFLLDTSKLAVTAPQAVGLSVGMMFGSWIGYDLLCKSGLHKYPRVFGLILFLLLTGLAYVSDQIFSDRAAYIQVGAIIGTLMAGNVFRVIIPNQKIVVAELLAGREVDPQLGVAAKLRSLHNNYLTLPVLFIMVSNHYPVTYAQPLSWFTLAGISLAGICVRHYFNLRHTTKAKAPFMFAAVISLMTAIIVPASYKFNQSQTSKNIASSEPLLSDTDPQFVEVNMLLKTHCSSCHSATPTSEDFTVAPKNILFDTEQDILRHATNIYQQVVEYEAMPLGDATAMTDSERAKIGKWYEEFKSKK